MYRTDVEICYLTGEKWVSVQKRKRDLNLLSVILPSEFEEKNIEKAIRKEMKTDGILRKKSLERIIGKNLVWMPYHKVEYDYKSQKSLNQSYTERAETALNAMFCGHVKNENELFRLFRPNYLKYNIVKYSPQPANIIGPIFHIDFQKTFNRLLDRLKKVEEEIEETRQELNKLRTKISRQSLLLPVTKVSIDKEWDLSKKVARLQALRMITKMSLNVNKSLKTVEVTNHSVFYYPTLVTTLVHKESGARYLIFNLVKNGVTRKFPELDRGLTKLCDENVACKEVLTRALAS